MPRTRSVTDTALPWFLQERTIKGALYITAGIIGYRVLIRPQVQKWQLNKALKKDKQYSVPVVIKNGQGTGYDQTINLATSAGVIYDAFYNNDPFGATEDETRAVNEIKKVPKAMIPALINAYADLYKKNLKQDLLKFLDSDEWEKISHLFE